VRYLRQEEKSICSPQWWCQTGLAGTSLYLCAAVDRSHVCLVSDVWSPVNAPHPSERDLYDINLNDLN